MLWGIGMSVYECVEMTRCSASGGAYGAVGLSVHIVVGKVRFRDCRDGRISPGDSRPSARCGKVVVVAVYLLANRKM